MNREQAREIARQASRDWEFPKCVETRSEVEAVADALHAAYEAERGTVQSDARLASIKETARGIWAGWSAAWERTEYPTNSDGRADTCIEWAERLESAFERRYGAGGGK